jgi:Tol biopolymer transport system component
MRVCVDTCAAVVLGALLGAACGKDAPTGGDPGPGQFAFVSDVHLGQYDVYVMNTNGSGLRPLTTNLADDWWPTWSPDGMKVAFQSNRNLTPGGNVSQLDIYVVSADGTGETRLTTDTTNEAQPAWSPDGAKIAFVSDRDSSNEVYVMNADGTGVTRLTADPLADEQPTWSPDGTKIAFVSNRDGNPDVWVMNADGGNPLNLTNNAATDVGPAWSPDGTRIAFHSARPGNFAIFVMNADGTGVQQLTGEGVPDELPAWSPDGTRIAFDSDGELWVMHADGTGLAQVTHSKFVLDFMPRWHP